MSGIALTFGNAHIGPFFDPSTQLSIPRLTGQPLTLAYAGTTVPFVGDKFPTGFRGESQSRSYALTARYMADERTDLEALLALFDAAHVAADSRLLLRTHVGQVPGLDTSEAVQVFSVQPAPQSGLYWDVSFTAVVVNSTFAV